MSRIGILSGRPYLGKGREKGLAAWSPTQASLDKVAIVKTILAAYAYPITIRQIYYRMIGLGHINKTEQEYANLSTMLGRARRSGLIGWDAISDGSLSEYGPQLHDGCDGFIDWTLEEIQDGSRHLLDDWVARQGVRAVLWVESNGMAGSIRSGLANMHWPVTVFSTGGTDSVTPKYEAARGAVVRYRDTGQPTLFGHLGDYDESGLALADALAEDLLAFAADMGEPKAVQIERVLLTPGQIDHFSLPTNPGKKAKTSVNDEGKLIVHPPPGGTMLHTAQAEALDPTDMLRLVDAWLRQHLDTDEINASLKETRNQRIRYQDVINVGLDME